MELSFTKMHGLGNDFVLLNGFRKPLSLTPEHVRHLADRHFGVGCDQVLIVEPPRGEADVHYRIYNADGGEVEHCGNGVRCVARYLREEGIVIRDEITVETMKGGLSKVYIEAGGLVRVNMGAPRFEPAEIPMQVRGRASSYQVEVGGGHVSVGAVSMGNPHAVIRVDNVDTAPVSTLGPMIEHHPLFPQGVNVGFMQVVDAAHVKLRVFERGTGETLACGTGACAAVVVGRMHGLLKPVVDVQLPGGHLSISWAEPGQPVWMTGPAARVFEGQIKL
ncbi:MAG: diaminopimelate epimerase [Gammaproteobacteria bacterium]